MLLKFFSQRKMILLSRLKKIYPICSDLRSSAGRASGHCFHQDLLIARRIFQINPLRHIDISSRVDGFVAHVAVFREIEVFDVRPQFQKI